MGLIYFIGGIFTSKFFNDNIPDLNVKRILRKPGLSKEAQIKRERYSERIIHLDPITHLYLWDDYTVTNPTMDPGLVASFYTTAIDLLFQYELDESMFRYIARECFIEREATTKQELILILAKEMNNPQRNDSRFILGFRAIYTIMRVNLHVMDGYAISQVMQKLQPFFMVRRDAYKCIPGLS